MTISSAQAAAQYKRMQQAYVPKQKIAKTVSGEADVSYYQSVADDIAASLAGIASSGGEEEREAVITIAAPPAERPLNPVFLASIEDRKIIAAPLARRYVEAMDIDPDSEEGKVQVQSAIDFYSRNETLIERFEALIDKLYPDTE